MKYLFSVFQIVLTVLLILLVAIFVVVMFSENPKWIFDLLGIAEKGEPKYEALKFLGIGMGGILIALQALMSYKRAKAMEDTAQAQADAVLKTEQGQRQDRLKNAIEHLGHESDSVRLGGAYELFHLAQDTENLRQTVLDILCAHIRRTTSESEYREKHKSKPSEEVQSLLTLLFVQECEVFRGCHINLQGSWLNGVNLEEARLKKAVLTEAHLQGAKLRKAQLQSATLYGTQLQGATIHRTQLRGATLYDKLQILNLIEARGADLSMINLQGATLYEAQLQGAILNGAQLQGATLYEVQLQGATLYEAQLQGAILNGAQLQGATLYEAQLRGTKGQVWSSATFSQRMRESIGQESDLSGLIFEGGLSQKALDSLVEGLSDEIAEELRERLESHIGRPKSNELPKDSGAITGSYTEEEAEQWIDEYEKSMSEVPEDDS